MYMNRNHSMHCETCEITTACSSVFWLIWFLSLITGLAVHVLVLWLQMVELVSTQNAHVSHQEDQYFSLKAVFLTNTPGYVSISTGGHNFVSASLPYLRALGYSHIYILIDLSCRLPSASICNHIIAQNCAKTLSNASDIFLPIQKKNWVSVWRTHIRSCICRFFIDQFPAYSGPNYGMPCVCNQQLVLPYNSSNSTNKLCHWRPSLLLKKQTFTWKPWAMDNDINQASCRIPSVYLDCRWFD